MVSTEPCIDGSFGMKTNLGGFELSENLFLNHPELFRIHSYGCYRLSQIDF